MKIDLTRDPRLLTEAWISAFGEWSKALLKYMYGKDTKVIANLNEDEQSLKFIIRGEQKDVKAYAVALFAEKDYLEAYAQFGKDHPMTNKQRIVLDQAVGDFENKTGITWPFKDED
jgi:hypothetical protein